MEDKQLSTGQSLDIISKMIATTRRNFKDHGGTGLLIGGYTTFAITITVAVLLHFTGSRNVMWLWCAIPLIVGILTWRHFRKSPKPPVQTYLDRVVKDVWVILIGAVFGCVVSIIITELIDGKSLINPAFTIGVLMCMATAITGRILFRYWQVSIWAFVGLGLSFAIPALESPTWQLSVFAAAVLFALIIPGHLLNAACKKEAKNYQTN